MKEIKDPFAVLKYPLSTEKAVRLMESENKLLFVVNRKANKKDIKNAFEKMFKVKVVDVNTLIDGFGYKRAYIKISAESPAIDVMTQLGLM